MTAPDNRVDVLHYHAATLDVCQRYCFIEGFPCAAVDYSPAAMRCAVHFGPVSVTRATGERTCYVKSFSVELTEESE